MSKLGLEVLAPAGDPEIFKRVIDAGADAVYFGGSAFGARAYATNFTLETAEESIRYAHARGKKAYLTVNTLLKNREMEDSLYEYLKAYHSMGLDAVIVQDFGVFSMVRDCFPEMGLHCSTQMSLSTPYGARFLQQQGATRIVTAREISLDEIHDIYEATGVEIETFVHGALCVSYSGQCLMSSFIGGRSGNRGRCAQPCRLPYEAYDVTGKKLPLSGNYPISPKDLCGIRDIPAMSEAGVYSLKIEGRMKQGDYAEGVVAMYRNYVDRYLAEGTKHYHVSDADYERLLNLGNRGGFTNSYYFERNASNLISYTDSAHHNQKEKPTGERKAKWQLPIHGTFYAALGEPMSFTVMLLDGSHSVTVTGDAPQEAQKQAATEESVRQKLEKTGNTPYRFEELYVALGEGLFIPATQLNELRRDALEQLEVLLTEAREREVHSKPDLSDVGNPTITSGTFVTLRDADLLDVVLDRDYITYVGLDTSITFQPKVEVAALVARIHDAGKQAVCMMPMMFRKNTYASVERMVADETLGFDYYMATTTDAYGYLLEMVPSEQILLDQRLYTYSDRTQAAFAMTGCAANTVPYELNEKELLHRENDRSFFTVYGYTPMMYMANCTHKNFYGCNHQSEVLYLKDRLGNRFPVVNACDVCTNVIYNFLPTNLIGESSIERLGALGHRLDFTIESRQEALDILTQYETWSRREGSTSTKGHFRRGVE